MSKNRIFKRMRRLLLVLTVMILSVTALFVHVLAADESVKITSEVSLTLNEKIDLSFYVQLTGIDDKENVIGTFADDEGNVLATVKGSEATEKDGLYRFIYTGITPQYLDKKITLTVYYKVSDSETISDTATYSVADYLGKAEKGDDLKLSALATALRNYGAAAQDYTGLEVTVGSLGLATPTVKVTYPMALTGTKSDNVSFLSAGLILSNDVKMYFNVNTSLTNPTVRIGGATTDNFTFDGERVVVSLLAGQLFDEVTVNFSDGQTAHYSVAQYIATKQNDAFEKLVYLVERLYVYAESVHNYAGNRHYVDMKDGKISCVVCSGEYSTLDVVTSENFEGYNVGDNPVQRSGSSKIVEKDGNKYLYIIDDNSSNNVAYDKYFTDTAKDFVVVQVRFMPQWTEEDGTVQTGVLNVSLVNVINDTTCWENPSPFGKTTVNANGMLTVDGVATQIKSTPDTWYTIRSVYDMTNMKVYTYLGDVRVLTRNLTESGNCIASGMTRVQITETSDGECVFADDLFVYSGNIQQTVTDYTAPTCEGTGKKTLFNPYTGEKTTETIPATGHSMEYVKVTDTDNVSYICRACTVCKTEDTTVKRMYLNKKQTFESVNLGRVDGTDTAQIRESNGNRYFEDGTLTGTTSTYRYQFKFSELAETFVFEIDVMGDVNISFNYSGGTSAWYAVIAKKNSGGYITVDNIVTETKMEDDVFYNIRLVADRNAKTIRVYINDKYVTTKGAADFLTAGNTNATNGGGIKVFSASKAMLCTDNWAYYTSDSTHTKHTWIESRVILPTENQPEAKTVYVCSECGEAKSEHAHTLTATVSTDKQTVTYTCANCDFRKDYTVVQNYDFEDGTSRIQFASNNKVVYAEEGEGVSATETKFLNTIITDSQTGEKYLRIRNNTNGDIDNSQFQTLWGSLTAKNKKPDDAFVEWNVRSVEGKVASDKTMSLLLYSTTGANALRLAYYSGGVIYTNTDKKVKIGTYGDSEWSNLKINYSFLTDNQVLVTYYIDGVRVYQTTLTHKLENNEYLRISVSGNLPTYDDGFEFDNFMLLEGK